MKKCELNKKTVAVMTETKEAILTIYNSLNQGQKKKIRKNPEVQKIFERYGIEPDA